MESTKDNTIVREWLTLLFFYCKKKELLYSKINDNPSHIFVQSTRHIPKIKNDKSQARVNLNTTFFAI